MTIEELNKIVDEIIANHTEHKTTPRELLEAFDAYRRTTGNVDYIDRYLRDHNLQTTPDYTTGWIGKEITLKEAQSKETEANKPLAKLRYMPTWNDLKTNGFVAVKMGIPVVKVEHVQAIIDYLSKIGVIKDKNGISINGDEFGISESAYVQLCSDLELLPWKEHSLPPLASEVSTFIHKLAKASPESQKNKAESKQNKGRVGDGNIISSFHIVNYKNIETLSLMGLKRVNLFVGANNAGKSNLLEAISLYATNFSPYRMKDLLRERNENLDYFESINVYPENELIKAFAPFMPHRDVDFLSNDNYIELGSEDGTIRLLQRIAKYREEDGMVRLVKLVPFRQITANQRLSTERQAVLVSLPTKGVENKKSKTSRFYDVLHMTKFTTRGIEIQPTGTTNRFRFQHINCKRLTTDKIEDIWAQVAMTDVEKKVLEALQIVDNRIEKFGFIKNDSRKYAPFVHLKGEKYNMPISEMGDGMTHILNIIIALLGCENGVLLLDEAESGLHYLTQQRLWRLIFELAKIYNVQVFATTHSNDCINAFAHNMGDNQGIMFRLDKGENGIITVPYADASRITFAIEENIDLR